MARNFPNWLTAYATYTADSESPREFHLWTGIWTLAGALRRRVWIDMRKFQWTPNFYIVLVGPPGIVNKSTTSPDRHAAAGASGRDQIWTAVDNLAEASGFAVGCCRAYETHKARTGRTDSCP